MRKKNSLSMLLSASLACTSLLQAAVIPAAAAAEDVEASIGKDAIVLENSKISRTFAIEDSSIRTSAITNKRINRTLTPQSGSEDFVINTLVEEDTSSDTQERIENVQEFTYNEGLDRSEWTATLTNGAGTKFSDASVASLFDGNLDTYINEYAISGNPFTLDIDLQSEQTLAGFSVNKRPGYSDEMYGINGTMGGYEVYVTNDTSDWGEPVAVGEFTDEDYNLHQVGDLYNVGDMVWCNFDQAVSGRYVRIVQTSQALSSAKEFSSAEINLYSTPVVKTQVVKVPTQALDQSTWSGSIFNSSGVSFEDSSFAAIHDGNLDTYPNEYTKPGYPMTIEFDFGSEQTVQSFSVDKRPGYSDVQYGVNGTMGKYEVYVSSDKQNWSLAGTGEFTKEAYNLHQEGSLYNVGDRVYANLNEEVTTRYLRLVQLSDALGSTEEMTLAEVNFYSDAYQGPDYRTENTETAEHQIRTSDMEYKEAKVEDTENGKKLTISYEDVEMDGNTWSIDSVYVLDNDAAYMRSFLEIQVSDPNGAAIDYIDQDAFVISEADMETLWSHPDVSEISSMWIRPRELVLGQPLYVSGLYMGSEFPAAETQANDNELQIRYYSGKNFAKLAEDNQLTTDGKFVSWQNVVGSARGTSEAEVQTDFFEYIEEIATPTDFRKQYNSWYDNMMNITDESIAASFTQVEDGLSAAGVEPMDSYVVDDGWNNYYDGTYLTNPGSTQGTTPNQTGFWEFNAKFPNELYTSASLSNKLTSTFGVWVGPQGGYNYFGPFGRFIEASGTGYAQTNSALGTVVCTGSRKYIENFKNMAIDYQNRFGVEYWKWDGFASRPCNNPDHDHMTGGSNDMYFTVDMWEAWIDLFDAVREANAKNGKDLFINATCYVNLSPWLLQWVNTIWLQDSGDTGQLGTGERHEQKIYYRDEVYYRLLVKNDIQFPLKNLYNHDPIYGVSDGSDASDEVFREYLIDNAMRGTAFWELYYSPSLMNDEKYEITADILDFAESNHEILKNAKIFGNDPQYGVYGYSAWNGAQGIVSFVNPLDTAASYDLVINSQIGADESVQNLSAIQAEPFAAGTLDDTFSYGDTIHVELEPHESRVLVFGCESSEPVIAQTWTNEAGHLCLKLDQRVELDSVLVNGAQASGSVHADYRTVEISTPAAGETDVTLNLKDTAGNAYTLETTVSAAINGTVFDGSKALGDASWRYEANGDLLWLESEGALKADLDESLDLSQPFSVTTGVKTTGSSLGLIQAGDLSIEIDEDGFVKASLGSNVLSSRDEVITVDEKAHGTYGTDEYVPTTTTTTIAGAVNDGEEHAIAVKLDANGLLKLYVDGEISQSVPADLSGIQAIDSVTIGDDKLEGDLLNPVLNTYSIRLADIPSLETEAVKIMLDRSGWTASACSEETAATGDSNAMAALDGNLNTWWHTRYNSPADDHDMGDHWIQVNFNKEETFDTFYYTGRGTSNGSVKDFRLELLDENGNVTETFTGTLAASDSAVAYDLGGTYSAYGFKLTPLSTQNGANFAAAKELELGISDPAMSDEDLTAKKAALLENVKDFQAEDYTDATANPLTTLIVKIEALEECGNYQWNELEEQFNEAFDNLVNCKELKETIAKASSIADKGEELEQALKQAENAAKASRSEEEVQAALDNLKAALENAGPVTAANKTLLQQAVDYVDGLSEEDLKNLNPIVAKELDAAMSEAKGILADEKADQASVDASWKRLTRVIQMLSFTSNKEVLGAVIEQAEAIDLSKYEAEGQDEFKAALENAKEVYGDDYALDERIEEAVTRLNTAMNALTPKAEDELNVSILQFIYDICKAADLNDFTSHGQDEFKAAMAKAEAVLADPKSQDEIDQAARRLNKAWLALRLKPGEEMLETLKTFLTTVENLDWSLYTAETQSRIRAAYRQVSEGLANPDLTRDEAAELVKVAEETQKLIDNPDAVNAPALDAETPADKITPSAGEENKAAAATESRTTASTTSSVKTSAFTSRMMYGTAALAAAAGLLMALKKRR